MSLSSVWPHTTNFERGQIRTKAAEVFPLAHQHAAHRSYSDRDENPAENIHNGGHRGRSKLNRALGASSWNFWATIGYSHDTDCSLQPIAANEALTHRV